MPARGQALSPQCSCSTIESRNGTRISCSSPYRLGATNVPGRYDLKRMEASGLIDHVNLLLTHSSAAGGMSTARHSIASSVGARTFAGGPAPS